LERATLQSSQGRCQASLDIRYRESDRLRSEV
jgi:hypothetical protein